MTGPEYFSLEASGRPMLVIGRSYFYPRGLPSSGSLTTLCFWLQCPLLASVRPPMAVLDSFSTSENAPCSGNGMD